MDPGKMPHLAILLAAFASAALAAGGDPKASPAKGGAEYRIGPQDGLTIKISHPDEPEIATTVTPVGDIIFPQLGRIRVAGMTPIELEKHLTTLLRDGYYVDPKVIVYVTDPRSKKVLVLGEARQPGEIPVVTSITLVELVTKVGGPSPMCSGKLTLIRRGEPGERETMNFELASITAGDKESAFELRPGDIVLFNGATKVGTVYVMGQVRSPGVYPLAKGMAVQHIIILAGGMTRIGSKSKMYVTRKVDGKATVTKVGLDDVVQDGDTLEIKEGWF